LSAENSSGSLNQVLSYSYNNDFALIQAVYAGQATGCGFDNDGLLTQAGAFAITRHAGNGLPLTVSGAGLELTRRFNDHGEVASQAVAVAGKVLGSLSHLFSGTVKLQESPGRAEGLPE
jgi:hypothetical protein